MTNNPYQLNWIPDLTKRDDRAYVALADAIADDIKKGRLKAGERLPPQRLLAYTLALNPGTVNKAYLLATKRGLISGEIGRGSFVRGSAGASVNWPNADPHDRAIDFCDNYPCPIRNTSPIKKQLAALSNAPYLDHLLQYQQNSIWPQHQSIAEAWLLRFGIKADNTNSLIASGALHAGFISILTLCRAGDTILTEEFTSQAVKETAHRLKLRLKGIKMDRNGIMPEHLESLLQKEKIAAVFLVPTLHNPTATVLPIGRRRKIAALLGKYNTPLIEDDIFAPLMDEPLPPISSFIPELSFYIAGLSKALAPALRIAFLKMPPNYFHDCLANLRITSWLASPLLVEIAGNLIIQGDDKILIREQRQEIKKRQVLAKKLLSGYEISTHPNALHVWLTLPEPWRAVEFKEALLEKEILVQSSDAFAVERSNTAHAVRICIGTPPSFTKVKEGIGIIRSILDRRP